MKTMSKVGVFLLTSGLALALFATAVEAGSRKVTREGARGGSVEKSWSRGGGSVEKSWSRGGGSATRDVTRTAPDGRSFERSSERVVDSENQSVTRSSSTTYPNGRSGQGTRTVTRNDDGSTGIEGSGPSVTAKPGLTTGPGLPSRSAGG